MTGSALRLEESRDGRLFAQRIYQLPRTEILGEALIYATLNYVTGAAGGSASGTAAAWQPLSKLAPVLTDVGAVGTTDYDPGM